MEDIKRKQIETLFKYDTMNSDDMNLSEIVYEKIQKVQTSKEHWKIIDCFLYTKYFYHILFPAQ